MIPVIAFVGPSHVGKTTVLEGIIAELKRRELRVAAIKHAGHELVSDTPAKDSWRFSQAGSNMTIVANNNHALCISTPCLPLGVHDLLRLIDGHADIALVEGFKESDLPKIEVHRQAISGEFVTAPESLLGVITDERVSLPVPQFDFSDIAGVCELILQYLARYSSDNVAVAVNGEELFLKPFMKLIVGRTVLAMVSAMKGGTSIRTLNIAITNKTGKWETQREGRHSDDK